jgi:putative component of membrane protein insertase Oxa1/YidC/SpoIIIJ protein YidD
MTAQHVGFSLTLDRMHHCIALLTSMHDTAPAVDRQQTRKQQQQQQQQQQ